MCLRLWQVCLLALILVCGLAAAERTLVSEWTLDADENGDGIADGWAANSDDGKAEFALGEGRNGAPAQEVVGKASNDGVYHTLDGLDPEATYLLTAWLKVDKGGMTWGPEGVASKYLHGYGKWIESRQTFTGKEAVTVTFYTLVPEAAFSIDHVRVDKISPSPLPIEKDTGQFLIPRPQEIKYEEGESEFFALGAQTPMVFVGLSAEDVNVKLFHEDLGFDPESAVIAGEADLDGPQPQIIIGTPQAIGIKPQAPPKSPDEYFMAISKSNITIAATSATGVFYGLMTLRQLCVPAGEGKYRAPKVGIHDWPAMPFRATYKGGATSNPGALERARYCARMKMNAIAMEDGVFYHLRENDNLARVKEYFAFLKSLHIEPIPLVQSFGWGMHILSIDPQCVEAVYIEDRPMVFATRGDLPEANRAEFPDDGRQYFVSPRALIRLDNPLRNPSFETLKDGKPEGWSWDRWGGENGAVLDDAAKTDGEWSLKLTRNTRGQMRAWQDFELPEGVLAKFTCDVKTADVKGDGVYMEIYRTDGKGRLLGRLLVTSKRLTGATDWQRLTMTLDATDHPWYRIYLRIQDGTGTAWFDNLRVRNDTALLRGIVRENETLKLTAPDGKLYQPGTDYEVIPGVSEHPFRAEAKPWMIARQPEGAITEGAEALLSYEYAPIGAMTYCPSHPRTQEIMKDAIQTTIRELGVSRLHIGHDEPRWLNRCKLCKARGMTSAELLGDELTRMNRFAKEADPEVRLMMWADALNPYHNAPHQKLEPANDLTPKDIIQCAWFYSDPYDVREARSLAFFAEKGFETTGSPWFKLENNWDWAQECKLSRDMTGKCLGVFYTSWGIKGQDRWAGLPVTASFGWNPEDPAAWEMLPWDPAEINEVMGVWQRRGRRVMSDE